MGRGRFEHVKWTDFDRTLATVPAFPEAVQVASVSHEGRQFRALHLQTPPTLPSTQKTQDQHRTDWDNDYLLYTLLCRDKVDEHYASRVLPSSGRAAKASKVAAKEVEPEVVEEVVEEKIREGPERAASISTRTVADLESEWARMELLEKFFDAHAADTRAMEQVAAQPDPAFERLRRARRGAAVVPGQTLGDLGIPGIDGEVGVKLRAPYVRGALEEARRAARPRRRADPEARVASEVRKAEQERSSSPSETLGDTEKQVIISVPHDQPGLKKEKPHKPRPHKASVAPPKEKSYMDAEKAIASPALDLICAEEDGFVQLDKVSAGVFRYEVRLANGRKVEHLFDIFAQNGEDSEDGIKEGQSKDVRKPEGRIKKIESTHVADAVMRPSAQLRGKLGAASWNASLPFGLITENVERNIERFPPASELLRKKT